MGQSSLQLEIGHKFSKATKTVTNYKLNSVRQNIDHITGNKITFPELYNVHAGWYTEYKELYGPISRQTIEAEKIFRLTIWFCC